MRETTRTLESKLGWPNSLVAYFQAELRAHFGEAWITGYEALIPHMTNDVKDRHVLAAAVHSGATIILTFNRRHFGREHLEPWGVCAIHPQEFLSEIVRREEAVVLTKLEQQAADRGRTVRQLLDILNASVPDFVAIASARIPGDSG